MPIQSSASPYEVYSRVAEQSTKNFFAELAGTAFVYWLAGVWRAGAILLFALFGVLTILEGIHVAGVFGTNATAERLALAEGVPADDVAWWRRASYVRLVSVLIASGLLVVLFNRIW